MRAFTKAITSAPSMSAPRMSGAVVSTAPTGPVGAALARFLYGLPFAGFAIVALNLAGAASGVPTFSLVAFAGH